MFDRTIFIKQRQFSEEERTALQALRTKYRATDHPFTDRELANLHFMRWLVRGPGWNRALDQPVTIVIRGDLTRLAVRRRSDCILLTLSTKGANT